MNEGFTKVSYRTEIKSKYTTTGLNVEVRVREEI